MRILGPDGNPIETGPPVSDEVKEILERVRTVTEQGDPASALQHMVYAFQSDVTSDLVLDTTCDLLQKMAQAAGVTASEEYQLFDHLRQNREDPVGYFQVGARFLQLQQPFLARPFLAHARTLLGNAKKLLNPKDVNYAEATRTFNELGQAIDVNYAEAMMALGSYEEAINAFHALNDTYGGLPIWLVLEMAECYALLRQIDEAEAVYQIAPPDASEQIPGMDEMREEIGDLLARARDFDGQEEMGLREWHYVQTRGMLLETNPDENVPGERFIFFQPSEEDVAYIVGMTAALLDAKDYAPQRILWLGESAEPLARLFAQWWEVDDSEVRAYRSGDNTEDEEDLALLVMAHSYEIPDEETYVELLPANAGLILFMLNVRWTERQPITPDITGFLSQACNLPWETRLEVGEDQQTVRRIEETRPPQAIAEAMAEQFPEEEECDEYAQEIIEGYAMCTDLILDHRDGSLHRKSLVTHSPIKSPRFGF